ncbi:MAG: hypothetical protein ACRDTG_28560 [Pseudonocardiaceae bacterium]
MTLRFDLDWRGDQVGVRERAGAVKGLHTATEHLLGVSRQRVPLEEGALERSGRAEVDETELTGAVSYDTVYARRQHEEMEWQHDTGRTAKYLEGPLFEEADVLLEIIGKSIRDALR